MKIVSYSANQTQEYAKILGSLCVGGELFCLVGDLGAGKTAFTQGLAIGLGVKRSVTSPTFVLMQVYDGRDKLRLYHMDAYRILSGEEALDLGLDEIWNDDKSVMVIEWADKVAGILPEDRIEVYIKHTGEEEREWKMKGYGMLHKGLLDQFAEKLNLTDEEK